MRMEDHGNRLRAVIREFIERSPENTLQNAANEKAYAGALVGFARGDDPLFEEYKDHVGPFYMTPWEAFSITFREFQVNPAELTVISWVLPHIDATKRDNRKETFYPAERWARGRIFGEEVNVKLREHVVANLTEKGIQAVAPSLTPQFSLRLSPRCGGTGDFRPLRRDDHTDRQSHACGLGGCPHGGGSHATTLFGSP